MSEKRFALRFFLPHLLALLGILGIYAYFQMNGYWVTVRPLWTSSMAQMMPHALCERFSQESVSCAWGEERTCMQLLSDVTNRCLKEQNSEIPFLIFQPSMGREYGTKVGGCVDEKLAVLPAGKNRGSLHCLEVLHGSGLANQSDSLNWNFYQRLKNSLSLAAIEELTPGTLEKIYQRGIANRTFDLEFSQAKIRARREAIMTAGDKEVLDFGRASFKEMQSLCRSGSLDKSLQEFVKSDDIDAEAAKMRPEDFQSGGKLEGLGRTIDSVPEAERKQMNDEKEKALAALIRSGAQKKSKPPTESDFAEGILALASKLSKKEQEILEKDPASCPSILLMYSKAMELDEAKGALIIKKMLSQ